jgi:hypothetical protein
MKAHIEQMVRGMAWADWQVLAALRDCPPLRPFGS